MTVARILIFKGIIVTMLIVLISIVCNINFRSIKGDEIRTRAVKISPYVGLLAGIYLFNQSSHTIGQQLSALIGLNITEELYALEGNFVAILQGVIPSSFDSYFTFVYLFGFTVVLIFPVIAYFILPSQQYLRELFIAYTVNYGGGALCYVLFVAYGPRNVITHVGEPMYELYPQTSTVTGAVNSAANVFPSLHVSLAVTVALLAWQTREWYPRWLWIASGITLNIIIATMYLGIHWLSDVITGIGLAAISVLVALCADTHATDVAHGSEIGISDE